jgi:1-acyl-sn-glycerol-3-phosphate acyltransferase
MKEKRSIESWVHQRSRLCRFYIACLKVVYWLLLRLEITGIDNLPKTGPAIVAINHTGFLDPVLLSSVPERKIISMSKAENLKHPILGPLLRTFDGFPVHRGKADRQALTTSLQILRAGGLLLLAPEGTRSPDGKLQPGYDGLALIATKSGVPIVPVGLDGTDQFKGNVRRLKRTRVRMTFGRPFYVRTQAKRPSRQDLSAITGEVMYQIAALLPPERRGAYADLEGASQHYLEFVEP